MYKVNEQFRHK